VQNLQETNLAWALIDAVKPRMNTRERNYAFVTLGAGDTFTAIRHLLNVVDVKCISLQPSLLQLCSTWLDAYAFHDEHEHLRRLIQGFVIRGMGQTATSIRRLSAAPKTPRLLTVSRTPPARSPVC
jgi:hypothetical protein